MCAGVKLCLRFHEDFVERYHVTNIRQQSAAY